MRISACHCLDCQKRTGSAFGFQARFANADLEFEGEPAEFSRVGDSGGRASFYFCPKCGTTLYWRADSIPGFTYVAAGAFADPEFPAPRVSVYDERKHAWVTIEGDNIKHE